MQPENRIISAKRAILYPTFNTSQAQITNFDYFGVSVLEDDQVLKLPNPAMRRVLNEAHQDIAMGLTQNKNMIVYPAEIRPLKAQVEFLQQLRGAMFRNGWLKKYEFVFIGECMDQAYCDELVDIAEAARRDGLRISVPGPLKSDKILAQFYAQAKAIVLTSEIDCNPRVIYEALYTDTPFLASSSARVPMALRPYGRVMPTNAHVITELRTLLSNVEKGHYKQRCRSYALSLREEVVYGELLEWMNEQYNIPLGGGKSHVSPSMPKDTEEYQQTAIEVAALPMFQPPENDFPQHDQDLPALEDNSFLNLKSPRVKINSEL